jgi:MerR family transcriptional regulator, thiopeptide resistance regulator
MRTVSQVARLVGITVRTLHHYDEIGLVRPTARTAAGYRLYDRADLERLQEVLFWRELGYGLEEIRAVLDDPGHDRRASLRRQLAQLRERADGLGRLIEAVESALKAEEGGDPVSEEQLFPKDLFDGFDPAEHEDEVRERWGDTDAYRESAARTKQYRREDWERIKDEGAAIEGDFIALLDAGTDPSAPEAAAVAEAHRQHISRWFYACSPEVHRGLAEMYVADERFTAYYEQRREGLARFVHDAILANAGGS